MRRERPSYGESLEVFRQQRHQIQARSAENARLRAEIDEAPRAGNRQAAHRGREPRNRANTILAPGRS